MLYLMFAVIMLIVCGAIMLVVINYGGTDKPSNRLKNNILEGYVERDALEQALTNTDVKKLIHSYGLIKDIENADYTYYCIKYKEKNARKIFDIIAKHT